MGLYVVTKTQTNCNCHQAPGSEETTYCYSHQEPVVDIFHNNEPSDIFQAIVRNPEIVMRYTPAINARSAHNGLSYSHLPPCAEKIVSPD